MITLTSTPETYKQVSCRWASFSGLCALPLGEILKDGVFCFYIFFLLKILLNISLHGCHRKHRICRVKCDSTSPYRSPSLEHHGSEPSCLFSGTYKALLTIQNMDFPQSSQTLGIQIASFSLLYKRAVGNPSVLPVLLLSCMSSSHSPGISLPSKEEVEVISYSFHKKSGTVLCCSFRGHFIIIIFFFVHSFIEV